MKVKVGLETIVSELPETVVTAREQSYLETVIPEKLRGKFNFPNEVRRLRDNSAAEILGEKVGRKALERAGLKPTDIDYVICSQSGGKYGAPMLGGCIHWKLGFPQETPVLNVPNAWAGFVDACGVAWNLVLAGKYKRILIVTVSAWETMGGFGRADLTDPMSAWFGDGAGAAVVSSRNLKCEFLSYYKKTFSEVYDYSGATLRPPMHPGLKGAPDQPRTGIYFGYNSRFFEWWQEEGKQVGIHVIKGALKKAKRNLSDLDMVISCQPPDYLGNLWIERAKKAGLSKDKWRQTWDKYGDLTNATIPVNLTELWEKDEIKKGSTIAWVTFSPGGHTPAMIVKWLV